MKKAIIGVMVAITLLITALIIYSREDKFEYYDTNNIYGRSPKCKPEKDGLVCMNEGEWIKVNQYSLIPYK